MRIFVFLAPALLLAEQTSPVRKTVAQSKPALAAPVKPKSETAPAKPVSEPVKEIAKADTPPAAAKPQKTETLHYNVNWPSGLSLGEAVFSTSKDDTGLSSSFNLDASIPGFSVSETAKSRATSEFCSSVLIKKALRGKRKVDERTEFDSGATKATRITEGGGKSEMSTSSCAKDALTFIGFVRRELAAGRLPAQQQVYYGGAYSVRITFVGTQRLVIGGEAIEADKLMAVVKGPSSEITVDLFFAKDAARTPLLIQAPLAMGKFAMELAR